jgi:uncharacterized protein YndB with AHSA1/START domain
VGEKRPYGVADADARAVRLRRDLACSPEELWTALTDAVSLRAWFGEVCSGRAAAGETFSVGHDDGTVTRHTVIDWVPTGVLSWSWSGTGESPSAVRFGVSTTPAGSRLIVTHVQVDEPVEHAARWHRRLDRLAAVVSGQPLPPDPAGLGALADLADLVELYRSG